jgi:hypothetical protein
MVIKDSTEAPGRQVFVFAMTIRGCEVLIAVLLSEGTTHTWQTARANKWNVGFAPAFELTWEETSDR